MSVDAGDKTTLQNDWEPEISMNYKHFAKDFDVAQSLAEQTRLSGEGDIL